MPSILAGVHDKDHELQGIDSEIQKLFSDAESAKIVGRRYLALNPHKSSRTVLLKDSGLKAVRMTPPDNSSYLKKEFDLCRENDFLVGNIIMVDGWVLSQSEVSLCAFLALNSIEGRFK